MTDEQANLLGLEVNPSGQYTVDDQQREQLNKIRAMLKLNVPSEHIEKALESSLWWDKSDPKFSFMVKNPLKDEEIQILDKFEGLIKKHQGETRKIQTKEVAVPKALKVTISDDHLGLEPNPKDEGLFQYEYNGDIYLQSLDKVFVSIMKEYKTHGKFEVLLLDNLGDAEDGFNGYTTRGGHELDQNMTNAEVFECAVDGKVNLIRNIAESGIAEKIIIRKVVNDNHSGDFGHTINIAVKKIINLIYDEDFVEVDTLTRFMEHRFWGNHCFILTHGKDKKRMFKGLPLNLDDKTIKFVNDYIAHYEIKSQFIHLEKGDLHQIGYQKTRSFDYRNFMSFAPPSAWVQHNFGDSYSGYSIQVIPKFINEISHTDYFLDHKKKLPYLESI